MMAIPTDATFHWFFNIYIADFQTDQAGHYKVYGNNSVKAGRDYKFELLPHSKCSIIQLI